MTKMKLWPKRSGARVAVTLTLTALAVLVAVAIGGVITAPDQAEPLRPEDLSRLLSRQEVVQDIDLLLQTIEDVHVNPYTRTSEAEFKRAIEELKAVGLIEMASPGEVAAETGTVMTWLYSPSGSAATGGQ